ncbi:MAG: hypothetical protein ACLSX2_00220 [Christensenellaceae bacterium]
MRHDLRLRWRLSAAPDPSRWTGRSSSSVLPRLAATLPPQGVQLSISQPEDSSCMFRFVTQYTRCGHHTTRIQSASPAPNGDRLAVQYAGWSLTATGEGFTLSRKSISFARSISWPGWRAERCIYTAMRRVAPRSRTIRPCRTPFPALSMNPSAAS